MPSGRSIHELFVGEKVSPLELPQTATWSDTTLANDELRRKHLRRRRRGHFIAVLGLLSFFWYSHREVVTGHGDSVPSIKSKLFGEVSNFMPIPVGWQSEDIISQCTNAGTVALKSADGDWYTSQKSFPVDFNAESLSLETLGNLNLQGSVTVSSKGCLDDPEPVVDVVIKHRSQEALNRVSVCSLYSPNDGQSGIVLNPIAPMSEQLLESFEAHINIQVPSCITAFAPILKMNLPGLNHTFEALHTEFKSIEVHSDDCFIKNEGLRAHDFHVAAKNSPITGFYNVTNQLRLVTSNAPIEVTVEAHHLRSHWPTDIRLLTSNAKLNANLSLINSTAHSSFRVFTKTSNSPTDVELLTSPIEGRVRLESRTSNAPALLAVDPAFEGVYAVHTSNAAPVVSVREGVEDPAGRGRERIIETNQQYPTMAAGTAYWGATRREHHPSVAYVTTSNNKASLVL